MGHDYLKSLYDFNGDIPGLPYHVIPAQNTAKHICFLMWDPATSYKTFHWEPLWLVLRMIKVLSCGHIHGCVLGEQMLSEHQACVSSFKLMDCLLDLFLIFLPK